MPVKMLKVLFQGTTIRELANYEDNNALYTYINSYIPQLDVCRIKNNLTIKTTINKNTCRFFILPEEGLSALLGIPDV